MILKRFSLLFLFLILSAHFEAQAATPFTLLYPTGVRPARITKPFIPPGGSQPAHEGVDLYAPAGSRIRTGAAGTVRKVVLAEDGRGYGAYVVVVTVVDGIRYRVTYGGLKDIEVVVGQRLDLRAPIGRSAGSSIKVVIQVSQGGMSGFRVPNVANPKPILKLNQMRLRPTANGLRLRAAPNLDAEILGYASQWHFLATPESAYQAMWLTGKNNRWLRVKMPDGRIAYASAQYLKVVSLNDPREGIPGVPLAGMNLDLNHPFGTPPAAPLANLGWVRINYNMSYNPANNTYGNTDLQATYNRYAPVIQRYHQNGNKVILILTHQFYGEGQGYNWEAMNSQSWQNLSNTYAAYAGMLAQQYAGQIYAYQIWNEQDATPGSPSSVAMPPADYAYLLSQAIQAIRAVDPGARIITGGHMSGPIAGTNYANAMLAAMPDGIRPNGIAIHPYGRGPAGSPYSVLGTIDQEIMYWSGVMPNKPLWITEWGVLDKQNDDSLSASIADHAEGFLDVIYGKYPGMVAAATWYAWADGMHNGFGLVNESNVPKQPLYDRFLSYRYSGGTRDLPLTLEGFDGWLPLPPEPGV